MNQQQTPPDYDPVYLNARREMWAILIIWTVFAIWVVGVSSLMGYEVDAENPSLVLGMPAWAFWGVGLPWLMSNVATFWFCLKFMADDPLGEELELTHEARDAEPEADGGAGDAQEGEGYP